MTKHGALAAYEERAFNIQQQALDVQRAMGSPLFAIEELQTLAAMAEELIFDLQAYVENESPHGELLDDATLRALAVRKDRNS